MAKQSSYPLFDILETSSYNFCPEIVSNSPSNSNSVRAIGTARNKKTFGRVYTPKHIVNEILDLAGYVGERIIGRHVIDNSCGDGAFLVEIVERYCNECTNDLKHHLETFIHGIEIDDEECAKCVTRLNEIVSQHGLANVKWDIVCADTLTVNKYDGQMDYVLGNPPYIRVHNLGLNLARIKQYQFAQEGMTDLYLVFYEIGLKMLSPKGVLGYITPSSFFNSIAGNPLRQYIAKTNCLEKIVDLGHYQAFDATAYTTIVILKNDRDKTTTGVFNYNGKLQYVGELTTNDFYINNSFYFSSRHELQTLREIFTLGNTGNHFEVKNGFATLADSFFIGDSLKFKYTIPVIKGSTGIWTRCIFPYRDNKLIPFEILAEDEALKKYYEDNYSLLTKRSLTNRDEWYAFGRTQGIKDVPKPKYSINSLIRNPNDIKLEFCPSGTGIYSGLYIVTDLSESIIREMICTDDFVKYISFLKKYKSGGYYTFSSKDLKTFLEYTYIKRNGESNNEQ